jgi:Cys-tRNA(Pro) deacylase
MSKTDYPITTGVRFLRDNNISFIPRPYDYELYGGTERASKELGVDEHIVIKTLVMETDSRHQLLVLMHGDCEVSTKNLARFLHEKQVLPASEATANRVTGYLVGGISPFGTRTVLPVYAEKTIFTLPKIIINGGKRGFLVEVDPNAVRGPLKIQEVEVGILRQK